MRVMVWSTYWSLGWLRVPTVHSGRPPTSIASRIRPTWMTDAGPLDLLVELRDRQGGRHDYAELSSRAVGYDVGDLTVRLASLDDIVASKEFAGRDKDRDALPELNELLRRHGAD